MGKGRIALSVCLLALVGAMTLSANGKTYPPYEQVAQSPSAWAEESQVKFTMRYLGLKEVDEAFCAVKRNGTTHVELQTPRVRGARERLPIFVNKSQSGLLKKLRKTPTGETYLFRGKIKFFKTDYYGEEEQTGSLVNVDMSHFMEINNYYGLVLGQPEEEEEEAPKPIGKTTHYLIELYDFRELRDSEKGTPKPEPKPEPEPASKAVGYREISLPDLTGGARDLSEIPLAFSMTYRGLAGNFASQEGSEQLASAFEFPSVSWLQENNLELQEGNNPTANFRLMKPPGVLGRLIAIGFGKDWEVATEGLAQLREGDRIKVMGVLYRGGTTDSGSRLLFVLEGLEKEEAGGRRLGPRDRDRRGGGR